MVIPLRSVLNVDLTRQKLLGSAGGISVSRERECRLEHAAHEPQIARL
jgi:hypothetical protein